MRAAVFALLSIAAVGLAGEARAEGEGQGQAEVKDQARADDGGLPAVLRVPADDPRKGPRLEYAQGPSPCPDEKRFRHEVAYWLDGKDHLAADSQETVSVRFGWQRNGYFGTVAYTDAAGKAETLTVTREGEVHCLLLARWVALKVAKRVPRKPPPEPCPTCAPCQACAECAPPARCPACPAPPPPLNLTWNMDVKLAISAYGMMSWLLTPNAAPAVGLSVDARGEVISVGGELRAVLPSRVFVTEVLPGAKSSFPVEMDVSQVSLMVVPCARWRYFAGCGVAQAGFFLYQTTIATEQGLVFGLGPRVGFEVPVAQRFAVFGFAEALFSIYRRGVQFTKAQPGQPDGPIANVFWDPPWGAAFFGAGVSVKFE